MPDEDILNSLTERELEALQIILTATASRTAITLEELIQLRLSQGASLQQIRADLLTDLKQGGRVFGEFRNAVRATANGTIHRFRDVAQVSESGVQGKFKWAAVLVNTCDDCIERHGKSKTWTEWEEDGLPRTNQTICKQYCRCMLIPDEFVALEPIKRKRGRR